MPNAAHTCRPDTLDAMHFLIDALAEKPLGTRAVDVALSERWQSRTIGSTRQMLERRGIVTVKSGVMSLAIRMDQAHELVDCIRDHGIMYGYPEKPKPKRARGPGQSGDEAMDLPAEMRPAMYRAVILVGKHKIMLRQTLVDCLAEHWGQEIGSKAIELLENRSLLRIGKGDRVTLSCHPKHAESEIDKFAPDPAAKPLSESAGKVKPPAPAPQRTGQDADSGATEGRIRIAVNIHGVSFEGEGDAVTVRDFLRQFMSDMETMQRPV